MAYTKNVWTDQQVERPRTYTVTKNQDNTITLQDAFGVATDLGTPVNATNMNHIEEGIEHCYTDLVQRKSITTSTGNSTTPVYVDATGKVQQCSRSIPVLGSLASNKTITLTGAVTGSTSVNLSNTNTININANIGSDFNTDGISRLFKAMNANFNAGVTKAIKTTHTAETDGFINWVCNEDDITRDLKINDVTVARVRAAASHDACGTAAFLPVVKGWTYWCNKGTLVFYPLSGV